MLSIRPIEQKDKEIFFTLSEEFYNSPAVLSPIKKEYHENTFNELMRSRDYLDCYILEYDGQLAGFGLLNITYCHEAGGKVIWIEELYVRESFRSLGIGRKFFAFVEEKFPAFRYRLEVEKENDRAVKLYKSLGYDFLEYDQMIKDK
jgi:GNAT superfamily N-acetyltransferase